jgi:hypothetical protein
MDNKAGISFSSHLRWIAWLGHFWKVWVRESVGSMDVLDTIWVLATNK